MYMALPHGKRREHDDRDEESEGYAGKQASNREHG